MALQLLAVQASLLPSPRRRSHLRTAQDLFQFALTDKSAPPAQQVGVVPGFSGFFALNRQNESLAFHFEFSEKNRQFLREGNAFPFGQKAHIGQRIGRGKFAGQGWRRE